MRVWVSNVSVCSWTASVLSCAWECVFSARIHALMYTSICVDSNRPTEALLQEELKPEWKNCFAAGLEYQLWTMSSYNQREGIGIRPVIEISPVYYSPWSQRRLWRRFLICTTILEFHGGTGSILAKDSNVKNNNRLKTQHVFILLVQRHPGVWETLQFN